MISLRTTTKPATTLVALEELRGQLRITDASADAILTPLLVRAQSVVEKELDLALAQQQLLLTLAAWPADGVITLPRPPLISVQSITYLDPDGAEQTVDSSDYLVETSGFPGCIFRVSGSWPSVASVQTAIRVAYTAGDPNTFNAPDEAVHAVLLLAAHFYLHPEPVNVGNIVNELPFAVRALLDLARWNVS